MYECSQLRDVCRTESSGSIMTTQTSEYPVRKKIQWFCAGFLWGCVILFIAGIFYLRYSLIQEEISQYPYEETIERFQQEVRTLPGWTLRTVPCGLPPQTPGQRIAVFEICARQYSSALLQQETTRSTAVILPCKIAIYEKNKTVYIARLNLPLFMRLISNSTIAGWFTEQVVPEQQKMIGGLLISERKQP